MAKHLIDLTGAVIGRWTVISQGKRVGHAAGWVCRCACGSIRTVSSPSLRKGGSLSCGCLAKELTSKRALKHGAYTDDNLYRLYRIYYGMRKRCLKPSCERFKQYGGRGIGISDEFSTFEKFSTWAMSSGYSKELSLDRVDIDGNYSPSNCRWIPLSEQMRNQTKTILDVDTVAVIKTYMRYGIRSPAKLERITGVPRTNISSLRGCWLDVAPLPV